MSARPAPAPAHSPTTGGLPREQSRWLMALARLPRAAMALACAAPLLGGVLLLVQARMLSTLLADVVTAPAGEGRALDGALDAIWTTWGTECVMLAGLIVARAALSGLSERAGTRAAEQIKSRLRRVLFAQALDQGPAWSRARPAGEVAGTLLEHVEALDGFFARYLPALLAATLLPLAFALALMPVSLVAGTLLLVTAPLIPLFMALVGWGAQAASRRHARAMSRLSGFFADRLRGAATLKMFGRQASETQVVADAAHGMRERTMAVLRIAFLSSAVLEFFAALGVAGMAVYFGLSFLGFLNLPGDPPTLAVGLFCLMMAPEAYAPLRQFAAHYHDRATAQAAVTEIARTFGALPDLAVLRKAPPCDAQAIDSPSPDAHTCHPQTRDAVLCLRQVVLKMGAQRSAPITLTLRRGEHLALMGPSGSGKTTLLETIARLRDDLLEGEITLMGRPLAEWSGPALRQTLACMTQRPYLFEASLLQNMCLGSQDAAEDALRRAAERACVTDFADAAPDGLHSMLGPRGLGISGGQAHRVALARLYLRDPALVLLDEPTAHLDAETERRVMHALLDWAQGRTLIVATHSGAVARLCDHTLTLSSLHASAS